MILIYFQNIHLLADLKKEDGIPQGWHIRQCIRLWARPGSASSRVGDISES